MSVLVVYATATGSTTAVAQRIAKRLRLYVTTVECKRVGDVSASSLQGSSAIIIGSAVQMYEWLKPARNFVHDNATVLKTKPTWSFSVGFPAEDSERVEQEHLLGAKLRKDVPDLRDHKFFYGRLRKGDLGLWWRTVLHFVAPQYLQRWGDERNWEAIEAWADAIGKKLRDERNATAA